MKSNIFTIVRRPTIKALSKSGILARILDTDIDWLIGFAKAYQSEEMLRKMLNDITPNVTGVVIRDKNYKTVGLVVLTKGKGVGEYRIDYYKEEDRAIIFSVNVNLITKRINIMKTVVVEREILKYANLVISAMFYLYSTKLEDKKGIADIVPIEPFGKPLY